jgi:hypothetical protein
MKHSTSVMQQINHLLEVLAIFVVQVGHLTKNLVNVEKNCSFNQTFDEPKLRIEHNKKPRASMKSFNGFKMST